MNDTDFSHGKRDKKFHLDHLSRLEKDPTATGTSRAVGYYEARVDLHDEDFADLADELECSPSIRAKLVKAGSSFISELSGDQRTLLPDSASTLYALATASPELWRKALHEKVITPKLKREEWLAWMRKA